MSVPYKTCLRSDFFPTVQKMTDNYITIKLIKSRKEYFGGIWWIKFMSISSRSYFHKRYLKVKAKKKKCFVKRFSNNFYYYFLFNWNFWWKSPRLLLHFKFLFLFIRFQLLSLMILFLIIPSLRGNQITFINHIWKPNEL